MPLLHKYIVITSNYSLYELFPDKVETDRQGNARTVVDNSFLRDAISRRTQEFEAESREDFDDIRNQIELLNVDMNPVEIKIHNLEKKQSDL